MKEIFIPLVPRSKRPSVARWSDPDPPVEQWRAQAPPDANWALRCDGLAVIDCDTAETAEAWIKDGPPTPFMVETGRGIHFYYTLPEGVVLSPGPLIPGIDLKTGPGAYVLIPPSIHPDTGRKYRWITTNPDSMEGGIYNAPEAPPEVAELWRARGAPKDVGDGEGWRRVPEGMRNNFLASVGGNLRKQGADLDTIAKALLGMNEGLNDPPLSEREVLQIAQSVGRYEPEPDLDLDWDDEDEDPVWRGAHEMQLPGPVPWLWKPYVPQGRLILMDGSEGIGKGMMCVRLALATVTGDWPDGNQHAPGNVLWLPAEDEPEQDILKRLHAAGYAPGETPGHIWFTERMPEFPKHIESLAGAIEKYDAKLVILDPGRSYIKPEDPGVKMSYNDESAIRPGLQALNKLMQRTGVTGIFVHHWNKSTDASVQYRSSGTGAFAQVVRHRITMAQMGSSGNEQAAFEVSKTNLGTKGHVRSYRLDPHEKLDTAHLVIGDPLPEYDHLDGWMKAMKHAQEDVELDWTGMVEDWLTTNVMIGMPIPKREELMQAIPGLSQRKAQAAIQEMGEKGSITPNGQRKPSTWNGV